MKIGLITKEFSLRKGGLEKYTFLLSRQLVRAGHEVHVFANRWQDVPDIFFHKVPMIRLSLPLKNFSFALFSRKMLQATSLDIVHSMERTLYQDVFRASEGIVPFYLKEQYPNPVVRSLKALGPRRLVLFYLENMIFRHNRSRFFMTNSRLVKQHIVQYYQVSPDRIHVIYNGVDTQRFHPGVKSVYRAAIRDSFGIHDEDMLLLYISNNHKRKGLAELLTVIGQLENEKIRLMVVGKQVEKSYRQWCEKNLADVNRVIFIGPSKDVEKYYAAADVFVLPTRYDAFANVCLEAMACGLPVITTRNNGASELIDEGTHGFVLEKVEPHEMMKKLEPLKSVSERIRMGRNAAVRAKEFTIERNCSEVIELYKSILNRRQD